MYANHTIVLRIRGLSAQVAEPARQVYRDGSSGVTLRITRDPTDHAMLAWRRVGMANVLLNGIVGNRGPGPLDELEEEETKKEIERATERFGQGPYLVFRREDTIADFECREERSLVDFDIGIGGPLATGVRQDSRQALEDILAGLSILLPEFWGYDEVVDAVTYARPDGRPFFVFTMQAQAHGEVGRTVPEDRWAELDVTIQKVTRQRGLESVTRLLRNSLARHEDRLRAFLAAWFGLEILVGKTFAQYEAAFFARVVEHTQKDGPIPHVDRIRDVMRDKYRLSDRFSMIATELAGDDADDDLLVFTKVKKVRDRLLHGQEVPDASLPLEEARSILRRYLELHLYRVESDRAVAAP